MNPVPLLEPPAEGTAVARDMVDEDSLASAMGDVLLGTRAIGRLRAAGVALGKGSPGPGVTKVLVTFDVHRGRGQITGIDLFDSSGQPVESDQAEELLESAAGCPAGHTIGTLLDQGILAILESRHPGWERDSDCTGSIGVDWSDPWGPDPLPRIAIHLHIRGLEHCDTW